VRKERRKGKDGDEQITAAAPPIFLSLPATLSSSTQRKSRSLMPWSLADQRFEVARRTMRCLLTLDWFC
jgi:hypothetical protein